MRRQNQKVSQVFYVDENLLEDLAKNSKTDFFASSLKFYRSIKDKSTQEVSAKQIKWLTTLRDIMDDKSKKQMRKNIESRQNTKVVKKFTWFPKKTVDGWVWLTYYEFL